MYLWLKAFHVISVIAWMAGMLYLPRLFVYHADARSGGELSEKLKIMERRLLRAIINPAMIAVWFSGAGLLWFGEHWREGWFWAKFSLVLVLTAVHHLYARWCKDFERDASSHSSRFFRIWNEIPTILMIGIVIFVIVKPF